MLGSDETVTVQVQQLNVCSQDVDPSLSIFKSNFVDSKHLNKKWEIFLIVMEIIKDLVQSHILERDS
jgi:hypothetical protein